MLVVNILNLLIYLAVALSISIAGAQILANDVRLHFNNRGVAVGLSWHGLDESLGVKLQKAATQTSLNTIEWIVLDGHSVSATEISALYVLKNIKEINIGFYPDAVRLQKGVIAALQKIKSLESLEIYGEFHGGAEFAHLASLPHLELLSVSEGMIHNSSALEGIGKLKRLKWLTLDCNLRIFRSDWLAELKQLEDLDIAAAAINKQLVANVSRIPGLRHLSISSANSFEFNKHDLQKLAESLDRLQSLEVTLSSKCSLIEIANFPHLRRINLRSQTEREVEMQFLKKLPKLEQVRLKGWLPSSGLENSLVMHPTLTDLTITDRWDTKTYYRWGKLKGTYQGTGIKSKR